MNDCNYENHLSAFLDRAPVSLPVLGSLYKYLLFIVHQIRLLDITRHRCHDNATTTKIQNKGKLTGFV